MRDGMKERAADVASPTAGAADPLPLGVGEINADQISFAAWSYPLLQRGAESKGLGR